MLSISGTKVVVFGAITLGALAPGGCARHAVEPAATYGSIKDDAPESAPVHRASARGSGAIQPVQRSAIERSPAAAEKTASAGGGAQPASAATSNPAATSAAATSMTPATSEPAATEKPKPPATDRVATSRPPAEAIPANTERLLIQGRQLFQAGKVQEARKRFISALNGLSPEATLELARTFDTHYLSKLGLADGAPDIQRALQLYKSAVERGSEAAKTDLARVEATMNAAPNGNSR